MSSIDPRKALAPLLDRQRGRDDDSVGLRRHLGDAPAEYLSGALDNPCIGPEELGRLLRNRAVTAELVARVGQNRDWMRNREVRVAFVGSALASQTAARQVLPHLSWSDLADVAVNLRLSPILRREAEKIIRTRLPEMAIGERRALAHRPSRGIVEMLREDTDPGVLRAVAGNERTTESDIVWILTRKNVPRDFLTWLSIQSSWWQRRAVLAAILRHPRTPSAAALRLVQHLDPMELNSFGTDDTLPRLVRVAIERRVRGEEPLPGPYVERIG